MRELIKNCVREYQHENGSVSLCRGEQFYYFIIEKRLNPGQTLIRERGHLDFISASEFFDVATRYVRGEIEWTEPIRKFSCKHNPNRSRGCTDTNCPRALGGSAYREIFGTSCPFRKTPHTR